jgi:hypothetical protein
VPAALALKLEATCFETPAVEEVFELVDHELRQATAFLHPLAEPGPVRRDRLIQHRLFRASPLVSLVWNQAAS